MRITEGVGAVFVEFAERVDGVAETLGHLVAVLVEDKAVGDDALECGGAADHGVDGVEGIEPAAGLVNAFCDEVGGTAEIGAVDAAESGLGERHRAGIEPHVDEVRLACHLPAAGADEEDIVDIGTVEVDPVIVLLAHVLRVEALVLQGVGGHEAGFHSLVYLSVELLDAAYAHLLLSVFAAPYRERSAPEAAAAEVPVLDVLEPLAETACTRGLGLPCNGLVERNHLVLHGAGLDEPGVERIVEHGEVGPPAVGIVVHMLLGLERASVSLQHHADVDVEAGLGRVLVVLEIALVALLDIASRKGSIGFVDIG